jgi:hypothetical protein
METIDNKRRVDFPKLDVAGSIPVSRSCSQELNPTWIFPVSISFRYRDDGMPNYEMVVMTRMNGRERLNGGGSAV